MGDFPVQGNIYHIEIPLDRGISIKQLTNRKKGKRNESKNADSTSDNHDYKSYFTNCNTTPATVAIRVRAPITISTVLIADCLRELRAIF